MKARNLEKGADTLEQVTTAGASSTKAITLTNQLTINRNTNVYHLICRNVSSNTTFSVQNDGDDYGVVRICANTGTVKIFLFGGTGQTHIGGSAVESKSMLAVTSTSLGFLPPRMTTTQRDAITSPTEGLIIYDLTAHKLQVYDATAWRDLH